MRIYWYRRFPNAASEWATSGRSMCLSEALVYNLPVILRVIIDLTQFVCGNMSLQAKPYVL